MEQLEQILRMHAASYPQMQPMDAVKLIYQNEFGGGHLVTDRAAALRYLHREYETVKQDPAAALYEDIGNGIVRVNLAAVKKDELDKIGEAFLASAAEHKGNLNSFREKLEILRQLAAKGIFAFAAEELEKYLTEYESAGFPMVSHSGQYREAYKPAYRIALRCQLGLNE